MKKYTLLLFSFINVNGLYTAEHATTKQHGYDVLLTNQLQQLMTAYSKNYHKIASLLKHKANPNITTRGKGLLHKAVKHNHLEIIILALEHGADPNTISEPYKDTPLRVAKLPDITQCLLDHKANLHELTRANENILHTAVRDDSITTGTIAVLCNAGSNVNQQDIMGYTPLHRLFITSPACTRTLYMKAAVLLLAGANPTLKNRDGKTPLDLRQQRPEQASSVQEFIAYTLSLKDQKEALCKKILEKYIPLPLVSITMSYVSLPWFDTDWSLFEHYVPK